MIFRVAANQALENTAFEEWFNKDREAADWWRDRASYWPRVQASQLKGLGI